MWRNWQTRKIQDLVSITLVEVRILSSALSQCLSMLRVASSHCGLSVSWPFDLVGAAAREQRYDDQRDKSKWNGDDTRLD